MSSLPSKPPRWVRAGALALGVSLGLASLACGTGKPEVIQSDALQCSNVNPGPAGLRMLTRIEYDNTIRDLLGDDTRPATQGFPKESQVLGFDNNADTNQANPLLVAKYLETAEQVATRAVSERLQEVAPCKDSGIEAEKTCGSSFIRTFGRQAFRRPLEDNEARVFEILFERAQEGLGYDAAVRVVLEAMLQSPQFLYRVEASTADEASATVPLGSYEVASRLSYFFWNSTPDGDLLDAAEANELATREALESQARRLLGDPRAHDMVQNFHRLYLSLDELDAAVREVPEGVDAEALLDDWGSSLADFVDDVFWNEGTASALFTSPRIYVNSRLAELYKVSGDTAADSFTAVDAPEQRRGLLTQPGLMALLSHADQTSPVRRGVFLREHILCENIPDPPPTVDNTPPDPDPKATTRERFAVHTADEACAMCHRLIDPVGFGFEQYDEIGRFRSKENGLPVDASGAVVDAEEATLNGPFEGIFELADRLADSAQVRDCLATHWYRYAMGRAETELDVCSLDEVKHSFSATHGDLRELLVSIALTDAFRYRPQIQKEAP